MKKIITLALVFTLFAASAFSSVSVKIAPKVLNTFNETYSGAKDVKWEALDGYSKATFQLEGQQMFAYYRENGEEIAITRNLLTTQLPIGLSTRLKAKCSDNQWITDLFEISSNGEITYFATLCSADQVTVLKADLGGTWRVFKKTKRDAL